MLIGRPKADLIPFHNYDPCQSPTVAIQEVAAQKEEFRSLESWRTGTMTTPRIGH